MRGKVDQRLAAEEAFPVVVPLSLGNDPLDGVSGSFLLVVCEQDRCVLRQRYYIVQVAVDDTDGQLGGCQDAHPPDWVVLGKASFELLHHHIVSGRGFENPCIAAQIEHRIDSCDTGDLVRMSDRPATYPKTAAALTRLVK